MMQQLEMFEAVQRTKTVWEMGRDGALGAAALFADLFQDERTTISFNRAAKEALKITSIDIPERKARDFANLVDMFCDNRGLISARLRNDHAIDVTTVDVKGRASIDFGHPAGFALADSVAGHQANEKHARMSVGSLRKIIQRSRLGGAEKEALLGDVSHIAQLLLPVTVDEVEEV